MLPRFLRLLLSSTLGFGLATALMWVVSGGPRPVRAVGPLYVATTGSDTGNNCQNSANPCATVQRAVDVAEPSDEILVAGGTYTDVQMRAGVTQTVYVSQTVTIRGGYTTTDWINSYPLTQPTTLDAQGAGRVVYIAGVPGTLENLTVTNGAAVAGSGGGLYATTALRLSNVNVLSNTAPNDGGGVYASGPAALSGGLFEGNQCTGGSCGGGGLFAANALTLTGTQFIGNSAVSQGGGASASGAATVSGGLFQANQCTGNVFFCNGGGLNAAGPLVLTGTQFLSNTAATGYGGGATTNSPATVSGALFQGNVATGGQGGGLTAYATLMLVDSLFMSNTARGGGGLLTDGALVLTNTQFLSNTADYGGGARFDGPAALNGGLFQNNAGVNDRGGGVYALNTLALTGTQFISNTAASVGGGVYAEGAVTANGALFERNQGVVGGGLRALSTLTLTDTQFITNTGNFGGGVYVNDSATVSGGLFADNTSTTGSGGGLSAGTLVLTGTQFIGNSSALGGGVSAVNVTLTDGLFEDNESTGAGGGLAAVTVTLTDTQFISNTAVGNGGGAHVNDATLSGGLFQANNSANGAGGGLYTFNTLALTDTAFISNTAGNGGGGAAASGAATANGGLFAGNQCAAAFCFGGGLSASSATLTGTQFLSNTAADLGGGLFANDMVLTNTQFYSNAAAAGGGGSVSFGTASLQGGVFANNQCTDSSCQGGGLFVSSVLTATGTRFVGNRSAFNGGAIYLFANIPAESRLVNVLLARNSAGNTGAAIYKGFNPDSSADIIHTTIVSSTVGAGAAIFAGGGVTNITNTIISSYATGIERASGTVNEDYNLFFNVPVTTTGGVTSGGNSLSGDPAFLNPGADDYHVGFGSAALDAGVDVGVATDFEDDARPLGRGFDIGYDEGAPITGLSAANSGPSTLGSATAFTATATGPNIMYQWNFGDGDTGSGATASHTYMLVGNYTAIVTAMNEVSVVTATTPVTITDVPISGLSAANSSPTPFGQTTLFTATVSAGSNVTYQWNFGDGDAGSGATASHTYAAVGNYIATVTTTNGVSILTATTPVTITQIRIYLPVVLNSAPTSGALPDRFSSAARSEGAPRSASRLHAERVAWRPEASPVRIKGFRTRTS